jgi:hypothetical protein
MACACLQGTVAYSNYGYKSNEELILGYGFMLEDNPADFFHVSLGLVTQTEHGELSFNRKCLQGGSKLSSGTC